MSDGGCWFGDVLLREVRLTIEAGDVQEERFESVEVLVDTGATYSQVPGNLLRRLDVPVKWEAQVRLADGNIVLYHLLGCLASSGSTV